MNWTIDTIAAVALSLSLFAAIAMSQGELAQTIASGLIGYMGRAALSKKEEAER